MCVLKLDHLPPFNVVFVVEREDSLHTHLANAKKRGTRGLELESDGKEPDLPARAASIPIALPFPLAAEVTRPLVVSRDTTAGVAPITTDMRTRRRNRACHHSLYVSQAGFRRTIDGGDLPGIPSRKSASTERPLRGTLDLLFASNAAAGASSPP